MARGIFTSLRGGWSGLACLAVLLLLLPAGCAKETKTETAEKTETPAESPSTAHGPATVVDPATAGTVSGSVQLTGTAPAAQPIDMSSEAVCHTKAADHPMTTETVVVNTNGTLRHVFVYVKEGLEGKTFNAPTSPVVLDQVGCHYVPHVFGIQVDQPLNIKNSDEGVLHNIHAISTGRNGFNFGMPKVMESTKTFQKPEVMVRVKCDVHSWMNAYAGVLEHPYHSVTGEDGRFSIANLPPGTYTIEAWHEQYGTQTQSVTVGPSETKDVAFTFQATS